MAIKLEIQNKDMIDDLEALAAARYLDVDTLMKSIVLEYIKENCVEDIYKIDTSVTNIKKEAKILGKTISDMIASFSNRFDVLAHLEEGNTISERYRIKVEL